MHTKWLAVLPALIAISLLSACAGAPPITLTNPLVPCPATSYYMVWWSPDGAKLAFTTTAYDQTLGGHNELFIMDAEGSRQKRIVSASSFQENDVRWSPDGQWIAFVSDMIDDSNEVYVIRADGTGLVRISGDTYWHDDNPSWSPDGLHLAYRKNAMNGTDIFVANSDGSGRVNLTNSLVDTSEPVWSPEMNNSTVPAIAFLQRAHNSSKQLNIIASDGSAKTFLADLASAPVWSPDGKRILFLSGDALNMAIALVNPDGSGRRILFPAEGHGQVLWLPDNLHVSSLLQSPSSGYQIEITDVDTLQTEILSFPLEPITYQSPSWSPDGTQAAFVAAAPTGSGTMLPDIYITSRDGSVLKRVTDNPGWHTCLQSPFQ